MPSSFITFNLFDEEKKTRGSNLEELAIAKATAWALFKHGSLSEGSSLHEGDLTKARGPIKSPPYKVQDTITRIHNPVSNPNHNYVLKAHMDSPVLSACPNLLKETLIYSPVSSPNPNPLTELHMSTPVSSLNPSSLLDTYEIKRISSQLDYYIESTGAGYFAGDIDGTWGHGRVAVEGVTSGGGVKGEKICKKTTKGSWLLRHYPVICGSRDDLVVESGGFGSGKRLPEKHPQVVRVARCLPRPNKQA